MTHDDRDTPLSLAVQQEEEDSSAVADELSVASRRPSHLAPPSWPLKNIDKLSSEDRPRGDSRNRQGLARLSRKDTIEFKLTAVDDRRDSPPPVAIADAPETQKPASSTKSSQLQIVQDLVGAMPAALFRYRDKWGNTPYQARILHLERERRQRAPDASTADTPKINPRELVKQDEIARLIRSYCIRRLPRRDALTALYKVGEDLQIDFDLSGLPLVTIDTNYLDRLSQVLKFESILSYVALPRLSVEEASTAPPVPESQRKPQKQ
ncbi:hypothetical protein BO99DRAFT_427857 [Aspergillus violaceofuscus CBS 115571]|uniref:Uncharacterized protein n=1 Tax=Aspergillus violaceofuscus (strain CBS 115571) TaxID=1450538 RepID=A0A2V5HM23_ASPV1|nr:hypothetical protein BO99DRAFT_427857 [Aspergillus violaceofuscus CBS 115571]